MCRVEIIWAYCSITWSSSSYNLHDDERFEALIVKVVSIVLKALPFFLLQTPGTGSQPALWEPGAGMGWNGTIRSLLGLLQSEVLAQNEVCYLSFYSWYCSFITTHPDSMSFFCRAFVLLHQLIWDQLQVHTYTFYFVHTSLHLIGVKPL